MEECSNMIKEMEATLPRSERVLCQTTAKNCAADKGTGEKQNFAREYLPQISCYVAKTLSVKVLENHHSNNGKIFQFGWKIVQL